jgi:hypothetical protein
MPTYVTLIKWTDACVSASLRTYTSGRIQSLRQSLQRAGPASRTLFA